ncbi:Alpha/Beta hydrolase protein [Flagelloscypha sp. PMI_526]|nr:Alpha/Beta hydrolase protein [Flagelloscypha sp. PMI_526]
MSHNSMSTTCTWPIAARHSAYHHIPDEHSTVCTTRFGVLEEELSTTPEMPMSPSRDRSSAKSLSPPSSSQRYQRRLSSEVASLFQQVDVDDTLSMYESALRRHFPQRDGWILTRNYPFHVFAESFYVEEPTDSIPLEEELHPSCVDPASSQRPDLSTLALVIEHVSCPGEPVLILDLHDTPEPRLLDDLSDSAKYRNAILLDIMGWQLNDVERMAPLGPVHPSTGPAKLALHQPKRSLTHPSTAELDESGLAWIDWAQSSIRQTSNSIRHKTVFEDVRNIKSQKAFATMAALIEDGLPPYGTLMLSKSSRMIRSLLEKHPEYELVTTGHSLGGALSTLAAISLKHNFPETPVRCYTYGAPRVGNQVFADFVNAELGDRFHRVVNKDDGVPTIIPREPLGYSHNGVEYWHHSSPPTHENVKRCDACGEDKSCSGSIPSQGVNDAHMEYFGIIATTPFCI